MATIYTALSKFQLFFNDEAKAENVDIAGSFVTCVSPVPTEALIIRMDEEFNLDKFYENIIRNLAYQGLIFQKETLELLIKIYDEIKKSPSSPPNLIMQKVVEILLVASNVSAEENFLYEVNRILLNDKSATDKHEAFDYFFFRVSSELLEIVERVDENPLIKFIDDEYSTEIKYFLKRAPILRAFEEALRRLDSAWEERFDEIIPIINAMKISFVECLRRFNGCVLRDGIMIVSPETDIKSVMSDERDDAIKKAKLLVRCIHETGYFLVRSIRKEFTFTSPGWSENTERFEDENERKKLLELGRFVELLLFDGVQPDCNFLTKEDALDFLKNSTSAGTYPLLRRGSSRMQRRAVPSLSSAADIVSDENSTIC